MGGSLEAVAFDSGDLDLELPDAFFQLILRIGRKILGGELARGVASGARAVVVFHLLQTSQADRLAVNPACG